nr:N-formylglutamate deformylase [Candidatus Pantoea persica]
MRNISESKEFVWNLATRPLVEAMNESSASVPLDQDEFALVGLTPLAALQVKSSLVAESTVNFECRLTQLIQLQDAQGNPIDSWLVLSEAVAIHIDESLLEDGIYQTARTQLILRAGGPSAYYGTSENERFALTRPDARRG